MSNSLDALSIDELRVLRGTYEDKLAALPSWRWLARWVYSTAVEGVRSKISERRWTGFEAAVRARFPDKVGP
jgi:hypothetical protein